MGLSMVKDERGEIGGFPRDDAEERGDQGRGWGGKESFGLICGGDRMEGRGFLGL